MTEAPPARVSGTMVGSYELVERIGAGGMGEVWKARDRVLDRLVALKFLTGPASPRRDLLHEARAASSLNHPNIVTIFQIGESDGDTYLAMEFVEGVSLRHHIGGPHDIGDAIEISEQIVDGLASAHRRGIIHRDLKPENIMIRDDGRVKLVDFGLAKHLLLDDASTHDTAMSKSGELVGTCSYMSPEQARGHTISPASDVFSLGIVMYELFSGTHPFRKEAVLDTLNAIVRVEPPPLKPPHAPLPVGQIVSRALQKEATQRYSSAVELGDPLKQARREWDSDTTRTIAARSKSARPSWWIWAPLLAVASIVVAWMAGLQFRPVTPVDGAPIVRSIAVMPFRSADQGGALIADSLPEDVGSALTKAGFQVASRTSAMQMSASLDVRAAAVAQNIESVLDGTIRVQGSTARIYVELVNTRTGFQIWSGTFTTEMASLLSGPAPAADQIASQVRAAAGGAR
jgi:TolB-like protein/predicted Ser/Thr protein kinase